MLLQGCRPRNDLWWLHRLRTPIATGSGPRWQNQLLTSGLSSLPSAVLWVFIVPASFCCSFSSISSPLTPSPFSGTRGLCVSEVVRGITSRELCPDCVLWHWAGLILSVVCFTSLWGARLVVKSVVVSVFLLTHERVICLGLTLAHGLRCQAWFQAAFF